MEEVIIRNNIFKNTGWSWGIDNASAIAISIDAEKRDVPGLHQRILIQNNKFVNHRLETVISVKGAEGVMIKNNTFLNIENNVLYVEYANRVKAISNKGLDDYSSNDGDPKLPVNLKE